MPTCRPASSSIRPCGTAPLGDGVRFIATITPAGGPETTLFDLPNHPRAQGEHRRWIDVVADLRPWAGQQVRLTLRTEGRQDPANDWAGWGEPVIVQLDPLTGARLLQSSTRIQERHLSPLTAHRPSCNSE